MSNKRLVKVGNEVHDIDELEARQPEIQKQIEALPKEQRQIILDQKDQVESELETFNEEVFDFDSEARVRKAGYTMSQAEDMAKYMERKKIKVGQIFQFEGEQKVLTPFKTVVNAQVYMTALQDRLFEITTVDQEIMVSQLKTRLDQFTSLSILGLITYVLKRTYNNLFKGNKNG